MAALCNALRVVIVLFSFYVTPSYQQLSSSQTNILLQLRKQLEYPKEMEAWDSTKDLCNVPSTPSLNVKCEDNSVVELKIVGSKLVKETNFEGHSIPNQTLSAGFSVDSFVTTLTRLSGLRVVILVSLGIWGPLSDKIHRLELIEVLDLSSNFLYGTIPPKVSRMGKLQSLTLDGNFFNDTVPDWFGSLPSLTVLSLKSNQLKGPFPSSLGDLKSLTSLALPSNNISGKLPDLNGLTSLEVLDLRENKFNSEPPKLPKSLVTVLLSNNMLSGEIPKQFGELNQLQRLDMSHNDLSGTPPATLFSLPNISYLNLESNSLSGLLPSTLTCSNQLSFVDISENELVGSLPPCLSGITNKRVVKFSWNCLIIDPKHQHEASYCGKAQKNSKSSKVKGIGMLIAVIGGAFVTFVLFFVLVFFFCRGRNCQRSKVEKSSQQKPSQASSPTGLATELIANARLISQSKKLGSQVLPTYRVFSLEDLQAATNNFNRTTYLGGGSIGKTYKGRLENGSYVAIKCLTFFKKYPIRNLKLRLDLLSKLRHPHLVCLLGHCIDDESDYSSVNRVFLVYEYVPNGDLSTYLGDAESRLERILKWPERLAVVIGIAKAVHFLHTGIIPGFLNNRLKTRSILLDENYIAKLSDYGLSIITEEIDKHEIRAEGQKSSSTIQSKASAWDTSNLDDDVHTFGFILLETLVGSSTIEKQEKYCISGLEALSSNQEEQKRILDPIVVGTSCPESLSIVISITIKCVSKEPSFRPSIEDVLWNLQYAAQVQATADNDRSSDVNSQA